MTISLSSDFIAPFDFPATPWLSLKLIPLAENITFLKAICKENGKNAVYTDKNDGVDRNSVEDIGGIDKYCCVDRGQFYQNKQFYTKDKIIEFITIFLQSKDITANPFNVDKYVDKIGLSSLNNEDIDLMKIAQNFISQI